MKNWYQLYGGDEAEYFYAAWRCARAEKNVKEFERQLLRADAEQRSKTRSGHPLKLLQEEMKGFGMRNEVSMKISFSEKKNRYFVKSADSQAVIALLGSVLSQTNRFGHVPQMRQSFFGTKKAFPSLSEWTALFDSNPFLESFLRQAAERLKEQGGFAKEIGTVEYFDENGKWREGYPSIEARMEMLEDFLHQMQPVIEAAKEGGSLFLALHGRKVSGEKQILADFLSQSHDIIARFPEVFSSDLTGHYCL